MFNKIRIWIKFELGLKPYNVFRTNKQWEIPCNVRIIAPECMKTSVQHSHLIYTNVYSCNSLCKNITHGRLIHGRLILINAVCIKLLTD